MAVSAIFVTLLLSHIFVSFPDCRGLYCGGGGGRGGGRRAKRVSKALKYLLACWNVWTCQNCFTHQNTLYFRELEAESGDTMDNVTPEKSPEVNIISSTIKSVIQEMQFS